MALRRLHNCLILPRLLPRPTKSGRGPAEKLQRDPPEGLQKPSLTHHRLGVGGMAEASGIRKRGVGARPEDDVVLISQSRASSRAGSAPRSPRARRGRVPGP
eukprot:4448238-Pyramimonas_sp.AAC.2